ncbi:MAG: right-handed parallel beta-helix repeat-containing protein, partial [Syntrophales bacterium]|nr:right-handed parallel beta-helix repeat-containing protein [Syntrophales bacterium]
SGISNTFTGNTVSNNGGDGIYIDDDMNGGENTSMSYYFTNNNVSSNGGDGIYMYIDPSNGDEIMKIIFMQGNTVSLNTGDGVDSYVNGTDPDMFIGDLGGYGGGATLPTGYVISTGGNTFTLNGDLISNWDIKQSGLDLWALGNTWTDPSDPQSTITGDVITSLAP